MAHINALAHLCGTELSIPTLTSCWPVGMVFHLFKGLLIKIYNFRCSLKESNPNSDEMPYSVSSHHSLHYLLMSPFIGQ